MRLVPALAVALCLVLAGCNVGYSGDGTGPTATVTETPRTPTESPRTPTGSPTPTPTATSTPSEDRLGWEAGYAANDSLSVTTEDGLNGTELDAVVARTMARIELLRDLEFTEPVPVEVISREEYRNRTVNFGEDTQSRATAQYWEALFLVGEDADADAVLSGLYGTGVTGYYDRGTDRIVLVSDSPTPSVDRVTLAHELVHALQDQRLGEPEHAHTRDARLAVQGLVEGDASTVAGEYEARCGGVWECIDRPRRDRPPGGAIARHPGVYLALVQPYASGPGFVRALRDRGGWAAVNDAYGTPPVSTEQTIHPETYPDDRPVNVTVADRSTAEWKRLDAETVGEAGIHVMFWRQRLVPHPDDAVRTDYVDPLSTGWDGDTLVAYTNGSEDATVEGAYVWKTVWDSPEDAREFQRGYRRVLVLKFYAREVDDGVYVVDSGPYADAFRVTRDGNAVTVVNAPDVEALSEVARA